jgi:hypothetical protein
MMGRYTHIIEDEMTKEVLKKERLDKVITELEYFTADLPEGRVYSLTVIDNFKNETMYFVK